ncbi:MAG: hypothetical protein GF317_06155 [Candidatus Lokiarchaeota archaeon]|nr:hypothetical protein [Candidatus Lokiarchaeota archaeon]
MFRIAVGAVSDGAGVFMLTYGAYPMVFAGCIRHTVYGALFFSFLFYFFFFSSILFINRVNHVKVVNHVNHIKVVKIVKVVKYSRINKDINDI